MSDLGWWAMKAHNKQPIYGYGTSDEADAWCARQNEARDIDCYSPHFIGETDEEAEHNSNSSNISHYGMSLDEELAGD